MRPRLDKQSSVGLSAALLSAQLTIREKKKPVRHKTHYEQVSSYSTNLAEKIPEYKEKSPNEISLIESSGATPVCNHFPAFPDPHVQYKSKTSVGRFAKTLAFELFISVYKSSLLKTAQMVLQFGRIELR